MWTRIKQWWCSHEFSSTAMRRLDQDTVRCPCARCGKVVFVAYGLLVPGKII